MDIKRKKRMSILLVERKRYIGKFYDTAWNNMVLEKIDGTFTFEKRNIYDTRNNCNWDDDEMNVDISIDNSIINDNIDDNETNVDILNDNGINNESDNVERISLDMDTVNVCNDTNQTNENFHEHENLSTRSNVENCYCANCKRYRTCHEDHHAMYKCLYDVEVTKKIIKQTSLRRKYSTLSMNDKNTLFSVLLDKCLSVYLCSQCYSYFTLPSESNEDKTKYIWPSLFWKILSSDELYNIHGTNVWSLIPIEWRKWWSHSVLNLLPEEWYNGNDINEISCAIIDVSIRKNCLENSITNGVLGEIIENCDKHLLPLIKCPWGCSEFFHVCGRLTIQTVLWRYLNQNVLESLLSPTEQRNANTVTKGSRNDYLSLENNVTMEFFFI
jgi:hypothetical protein